MGIPIEEFIAVALIHSNFNTSLSRIRLREHLFDPVRGYTGNAVGSY